MKTIVTATILSAAIAVSGITVANAAGPETSDKVLIELAQNGNLFTPHGVFTGR